jgi:hypothetical protein
VVPDRPGSVLVRVLERREARPPVDAVRGGGLACEEPVPGAVPRIAVRDVVCRRHVPPFRVAVAVVRDADRPVHMRDDRDRPGVGAGRLRKGRSAVPADGASRRVGPVQRRVDREQMGQVAAVVVHELVDPLDADRPVPLGLDRERGSVVQEQAALALRGFPPVAPHRRRRQTRREDLLRELPHRDLVVVDRLAPWPSDDVRPRHDGWDEHLRDELGHGGRVQGAAGNLRERDRSAHRGKPSEQVEARAGASDPGDEHPA